MRSARIEYRMAQAGADLMVEQDGKNKAGGGRTLRGYAAKWGSLSSDLGGFREIIRRGAFAKSIKDGDIRALWNHETRFVLGRGSAGTLRLQEDETGLAFSLVPPLTGWAQDLVVSVARRDVTGASFGFTVPDGGDTWSRRDGQPIRELLRVVLIEISIVSWPAYPQTEVHVREGVSSEILAELNRRRERLLELVA